MFSNTNLEPSALMPRESLANLLSENCLLMARQLEAGPLGSLQSRLLLAEAWKNKIYMDISC